MASMKSHFRPAHNAKLHMLAGPLTPISLAANFNPFTRHGRVRGFKDIGVNGALDQITLINIYALQLYGLKS